MLSSSVIVNPHPRLLEVSDLAEWRKSVNDTLVAVNGCFDLFHRGHAHFLRRAKTYGKILIAGINSDDSVRKLKGEGRPIQDEQSRARALLNHADFVCIFRDMRANRFLALAQPHVWCKSEEYRGCIAPEELEVANCSIVFIPRLEGYSTTEQIHQRIA